MAAAPTEAVLLQTEETSAGTSFSGSRYLFNRAAEVFGVELTEQEDNDCRALLGGAYLVDHLLDIDKTDIMPYLSSIIAGHGIPTLHQDTQVRFRNYMLRQSEASYDDIMRRLDGVSLFAHRQTEARTAGEVIDVRLEEADLLTHFLALPTDSRSDSAAREKFNTWLGGWSRTGYLLDTLMDLRLDYRNGDSGLKPSVDAYATIAAATIKESLPAIRNTPMRLIGKCAIVGFKYTLLNMKPEMTDLDRA